MEELQLSARKAGAPLEAADDETGGGGGSGTSVHEDTAAALEASARAMVATMMGAAGGGLVEAEGVSGVVEVEFPPRGRRNVFTESVTLST